MNLALEKFCSRLHTHSMRASLKTPPPKILSIIQLFWVVG